VELIETRALELHPALSRLGPDLLADPPDIEAAVKRLRAPERASMSVAEAVLDQSAVAGIGNVYRSELLFVEGIDPFVPVGDLPRIDLECLLRTAARVLGANLSGGERVTMPDPAGSARGSRQRGRRWVYRRAGLPCRRCATPIRSATLGDLPRRLYWCPTCQGSGGLGV
jgi:endonuclease-8